MDRAVARIASSAAFEVFEFQATRIGCAAAHILSKARAGRVVAVFDGGFYVEFGDGLVFLSGVDLRNGPLNLATSAPGATIWSATGARVDDRAVTSGECLIVGNRFRFTLGDASIWRPEHSFVVPNAREVSRGLYSFREAATGRLPREGLGCFVQYPTGEAASGGIVERARPCVRALRDWLVGAFRDKETAHPEDVVGLIGLGPGLTPSGDDLIGGAMIAAHALGEGAVASRFWDMVRPQWDATGEISRAHLRAASDGIGHEEIHRVIRAMLTGRTGEFGSLIEGIDDIGHSSGWDAIAGVTLTLDAWLLSRPSP